MVHWSLGLWLLFFGLCAATGALAHAVHLFPRTSRRPKNDAGPGTPTGAPTTTVLLGGRVALSRAAFGKKLRSKGALLLAACFAFQRSGSSSSES